MGKAQEAAAKKKNKAVRKRIRSSSTISEALQAHITAKRRRKDGKRRICRGMCFTLPTPEDPFNDRNTKKKKNQRDEDRPKKLPAHSEDSDGEVDEEYPSEEDDQQIEECEYFCRIRSNGAQTSYDLIVDALQGNDTKKQNMKFHRELWEACAGGLDIIGTAESSKFLSLAYVPAAVNHFAHLAPSQRLRKPRVLFIVSSREESQSVRRICKPLKEAMGIQTISIHSETPIEHQRQGLKDATPEFLVATPERLCELSDVVDLSAVSFMVVENLEALTSNGSSSKLLAIPRPTAQILVFSGRFSEAEINITKQLMDDPVTRVSARKSLKDEAACISQVASIIVDNAKKLPKLLNLMHQLQTNSEELVPVLILVNKNDDAKQMAKVMAGEGHKVDVLIDPKNMKSAEKTRQKFSNGSLSALISTEEMIGFIDLSHVQVLVNYSFPSSMETYCQLLTSIARKSVCGTVHSLCGCSTAPVSAHLVDVFKQCSQPVPSALELLVKAAAVVKSDLTK